MKKTILFLAEMPLTNGVIQAQLLPVVLAAQKEGWQTVLLETCGRFDSQESFRVEIEDDLKKNGVKIIKINVPSHPRLPSIFAFTFKTLGRIENIFKNQAKGEFILYARNYKFIPALLWFNLVRKIPFIYSPRAAYVAERKYYRRVREMIFLPFLFFLEKKALQKNSFTIVETEEFRNHLKKIYSPSGENINVIQNFFNAALLPPPDFSRNLFRQKMGMTGKRVIAYAGTVEVWYDFERMFSLVSTLKKKDPTIFFWLFVKKDGARLESTDLLDKFSAFGKKYGLWLEKDFKISSYPSRERYFYLSAADVALCLAAPQKFKAMTLALKIVDFWGAGLPVIVNREISEAVKIIQKTGAGAVVDYTDWENSVQKIDLEKISLKRGHYSAEVQQFSSEKAIPLYLEIFRKTFCK